MLLTCASTEKEYGALAYPLSGGVVYQGDSPAAACAALSVGSAVGLSSVTADSCTLSKLNAMVNPVIHRCRTPLDPFALDSGTIGFVFLWGFGAVLVAFLFGYAISIAKAMIAKL